MLISCDGFIIKHYGTFFGSASCFQRKNAFDALLLKHNEASRRCIAFFLMTPMAIKTPKQRRKITVFLLTAPWKQWMTKQQCIDHCSGTMCHKCMQKTGELERKSIIFPVIH